MKRRVNLDEDVADMFAALTPKPPAVVLAFDPSTTKTGWALSLRGRLLSGQGDPEECVDVVFDLLRDAGVVMIDVLAVEEPFNIGRPMPKRTKGGTVVTDATGAPVMTAGGNQWKLAQAGGLLIGSFRRSVRPGGVMWKPIPGAWRSVLGLNTGPEGTRKREDVNRGVWLWAKATTRLPLIHIHNNREVPELDRANAIALLYATVALAAGTHA